MKSAIADNIDAIRRRARAASASEVLDMGLAVRELWHELHAIGAEKARAEYDGAEDERAA